MADVRKNALAAHAAAREVNDDDAARSAARVAGHALATAHVPTHASLLPFTRQPLSAMLLNQATLRYPQTKSVSGSYSIYLTCQKAKAHQI